MIQFFSHLYYTHYKDSKPIRVVDDHFKSTHSVFWRTVKGAFLVTDNRVFNGPLSCLLPSFARTAHSAHLQRYACFACLHSHFAHSLVGQLNLYMFTLYLRFTGTNAFFIFTGNTPYNIFNTSCRPPWTLILNWSYLR